MTTLNGRNAKVMIGTYVVAEMASWSLDLSNDDIDTTAFGSSWKKSDVGMRGWSFTIEGHADPSDTDGQGVIEAAWANGSLLNDIRLHVSAASYWIPDVTTDSDAGGRVTTYQVNTAHDAVAGVTFTVSGSGPITFI